MKHFALSIALLFIAYSMQARICTSTETGAWATGSYWTCLSSPAAGDTLIISEGHTMTISSNLTYTGSPMLIRVYGTLAFDGGGAKITMPCGSSVIIYPGGLVTANSGGSSQTIRICNTTYWSADDGDIPGPMGWPLNILPVEVVQFSASNGPEGVVLEWKTATETGSDHFELLRSTDLAEWQVVGTVQAVGNSADITGYSLVDSEVSRGLWYYKLVQVDDDGDRTGNAVVGIEVPGRQVPLTCGPNPVSDGRITAALDAIPLEAPAPIIGDLQTGRSVSVPSVDLSGDRLNITLPDLASGNYVLYLIVNKEPKYCRFVVVR